MCVGGGQPVKGRIFGPTLKKSASWAKSEGGRPPGSETEIGLCPHWPYVRTYRSRPT